MKSDLIENPCLICGKGQRSCGHTKADIAQHYDRCREIRRANRQPEAPKRKHHTVAPEGPAVFPHQEGSAFAVTKMGGRVVRVGMFDAPPIRSVSDSEYCGDPKDPAA